MIKIPGHPRDLTFDGLYAMVPEYPEIAALVDWADDESEQITRVDGTLYIRTEFFDGEGEHHDYDYYQVVRGSDPPTESWGEFSFHTIAIEELAELIPDWAMEHIL